MDPEMIVALILYGQFVLIGGWFALLHWLDARRKKNG
jgi:hypothetical protein